MKKIMDPHSSKYGSIIQELDLHRLYYKYTVTDEGNMSDAQDIMYWLIRTYRPQFNEDSFQDSQRFNNIFLNEVNRVKNDVVERIIGHRKY
jgi:hypothetical protein